MPIYDSEGVHYKKSQIIENAEKREQQLKRSYKDNNGQFIFFDHVDDEDNQKCGLYRFDEIQRISNELNGVLLGKRPNNPCLHYSELAEHVKDFGFS